MFKRKMYKSCKLMLNPLSQILKFYMLNTQEKLKNVNLKNGY
jgi:hypothetical protein